MKFLSVFLKSWIIYSHSFHILVVWGSCRLASSAVSIFSYSLSRPSVVGLIGRLDRSRTQRYTSTQRQSRSQLTRMIAWFRRRNETRRATRCFGVGDRMSVWRHVINGCRTRQRRCSVRPSSTPVTILPPMDRRYKTSPPPTSLSVGTRTTRQRWTAPCTRMSDQGGTCVPSWRYQPCLRAVAVCSDRQLMRYASFLAHTAVSLTEALVRVAGPRVWNVHRRPCKVATGHWLRTVQATTEHISVLNIFISHQQVIEKRKQQQKQLESYVHQNRRRVDTKSTVRT